MTLHLESGVERGEIDNRTRDVVRGRFWWVRRPEPLEFCWEGNCRQDLAGRLTRFTHLTPTVLPLLEPSECLNGRLGDWTAESPLALAHLPPPARWLSLEWYPDPLIRVVLQGNAFQVERSEPQWRLTSAEDERQRRAARKLFKTHLQPFNDAIDQARAAEPRLKEVWDEYDYELNLRTLDAVRAKCEEVFDKYGLSDELPEVLGEELGWHQDYAGPYDQFEPEPVRAELEREMGEEGSEELEEESEDRPGPRPKAADWIHPPLGGVSHPIARRCERLWAGVERSFPRSFLRDKEDVSLLHFVAGIHRLNTQLAASLAGVGEDPGQIRFLALVARLKRCLDEVNPIAAALQELQTRPYFTPDASRQYHFELQSLREEILNLMNLFRRLA
jgi:hypothetical protein